MRKQNIGISDIVVTVITWALSCFAAYKVGGYLIDLFGSGVIFGDASFWNCVKVGFFSVVALASGLLCTKTEIMYEYIKIGLSRRLVLLTLLCSSLIGVVGVIYVIADFLDFLQFGIFDFGKIPWALGAFISVWLFVVLLGDYFSKIVFCIFFGGRRPDKMPVPRNNDFALDMGSEAMEKKAFGYAQRCYQSVINRTENKHESKWDSDTYKNYFRAGRCLAMLYWNCEGVKRNPQAAVRCAERVMKHVSSASKYLMRKYSNVSLTSTIRDSHYWEDMQKHQDEFREMVDDARLDYRYFASDAMELARILYLAYGAGDGADKNAEKSSAYFAQYIVLRSMSGAMDEVPETVTTVSGGAVTDKGREHAVFDFPYLISDNLGRLWTMDWNNGEEARYILDKESDRKVDISDSLSDGVVYLKKLVMASGSASYRGLVFNW